MKAAIESFNVMRHKGSVIINCNGSHKIEVRLSKPVRTYKNGKAVYAPAFIVGTGETFQIPTNDEVMVSIIV